MYTNTNHASHRETAALLTDCDVKTPAETAEGVETGEREGGRSLKTSISLIR